MGNLHDRLLAECGNWLFGTELDSLLREAAEFIKQHSWQPIETAPKNGRTILLAASKVYAGYWSAADQSWKDAYHYYRDPTRWMPLPAPQEEA